MHDSNNYGERSKPPLFPFGAWVRRIIDLGQMLKIKVGVDLRRRDAGMAEHFLHRTQIAGRLQNMRGK